MTDVRDNLPQILEKHRKWRVGEGGARANLVRADLARAYLARANLADAYLARANLADAYLARADLVRADLARADLAGADLAGANLAGANLVRADLAGANLAGAYLIRADLAGANLAGANLVRADLAGANLATPHLIDGGQRRDGYRFVGWIKDGALMIRAGCRNMTVTEYREHNAKRDDAMMRDETDSILDHIERVARVRGLIGADTP